MIIFSKHSQEQNVRRKISKESVELTLRDPEKIEPDKYDNSLKHYIKFIEGKFLRVVAGKDGDDFWVITYFYDRRLIRSER